jgi:hypothetical protein
MGEPVPLLPRTGPERPPRAEADVLLQLRPLRAAVPASQRLKQLLKVALRRFAFRLVRLADAAPPGSGAERGEG